MSRETPEGFAAFVAARGDALHEAAHLLTGDQGSAEELVITALADAWPRWKRLGPDPEPVVRRYLAGHAAPRWQRGLPPGLDATFGPVTPSTDTAEEAAERADERVRLVADRVERRVRRRRRVGAGALVVVVVAAVALTAKTLQHQPPSPSRAATPTPSASKPAAATLPAYYSGGHELESVMVDLTHEGSTALRFTPTVWGLDFAFRCPPATPGRADFQITVNHHVILGGDCATPDNGAARIGQVDGSGGDSGIDNPAAQTYWQAFGVRLGHPVTALITVRRAAFASNPPPRMAVAVYQDVPFADYPLPDRPDDVAAADDVGAPVSHGHHVAFPGGAANGTWTVRLPYRDDLVAQGGITGPGELHFRVNGVLIGGYASYDYTPTGYTTNIGPPWPAGFHPPRVGQIVTVQVTAEHFAHHDWALSVGGAY